MSKYPTVESVVAVKGAEWVEGLDKAAVEQLVKVPGVAFTAKAVFEWQKARGGSDPFGGIGGKAKKEKPEAEFGFWESQTPEGHRVVTICKGRGKYNKSVNGPATTFPPSLAKIVLAHPQCKAMGAEAFLKKIAGA